ncbi:DNA-processing protein DprA [Compostibacter hankyongensis]|uniref:DNA-processing protein DprA n=1 Tax=Compostibacter hankyongensis TaxID=1007089 RepID=A0ABP8FFM0_9BACT
MTDEELRYRLALTLVPNIGDVLARSLLEHFPTARDIFEAPEKLLSAAPGIGPSRAKNIRQFHDFERVEEEMSFLRRYRIHPLFYTDAAYPEKLRNCYDSPVMLYYRGNTDLNHAPVVGIVGTRYCTAYGKAVCEKLVRELAAVGVVVVSGLAYGIDIAAHKAALEAGLPTIAVLAHGLDRIYPPAHQAVARQMPEQGGLLTDFMSGTLPDKRNFPRRNRIVAGMADATIVVETGLRGGSMITAELANSYNRDVFAFPGRVGDARSAGCHYLIRKNKAALITGAADLLELMGWEVPETAGQPEERPRDTGDDEKFGEDEKKMLALLQRQPVLHIDEISRESGLSPARIATAMLNLEIRDIVQALPGKLYSLVSGF